MHARTAPDTPEASDYPRELLNQSLIKVSGALRNFLQTLGYRARDVGKFARARALLIINAAEAGDFATAEQGFSEFASAVREIVTDNNLDEEGIRERRDGAVILAMINVPSLADFINPNGAEIEAGTNGVPPSVHSVNVKIAVQVATNTGV